MSLASIDGVLAGYVLCPLAATRANETETEREGMGLDADWTASKRGWQAWCWGRALGQDQQPACGWINRAGSAVGQAVGAQGCLLMERGAPTTRRFAVVFAQGF